jgi:uncharacterized protein YjbJ (UPF0337 family)
MNWKPIAGDWTHFKASVKAQWSKLSDANIEAVAGSRWELIAKIRSVYGISQQQAEKQVASWAKRVTAEAPAP